MSPKLRKLSHGLGAEVCDIDIAAPMSESAFGDIHRAFLDYGILLFRNQNITREQHLEFSRRFGELDRHEAFPSDRHPTIPELMLVTNEPQPDGTPSVSRYTGRRWHTDMSHTLEPSLGSLLRCWKIPGVGGDTLFANMVMAYDALSSGMQKLIANLNAIHFSGGRKFDTTAADKAHAEEQKKISPPVAHPVVRVHPETGRKSVYANPYHVVRILGMPRPALGLSSVYGALIRRKRPVSMRRRIETTSLARQMKPTCRAYPARCTRSRPSSTPPGRK